MSSDKGRYLEVFGPKEPKLGPKLGISSFMKTSCASVFSILQEVITIQSLKFGLNNLCKKYCYDVFRSKGPIMGPK